MQWKDIKFWCYVEIEFPPSMELSSSFDDELGLPLDDELSDTVITDEEMFSLGAQGVQGCQQVIPGVSTCFDVLSFQSEFELNAIPTATVSVAIGRRADDVTIAADIHYYIEQLKLQLPATVWCLATSPASSKQPPPGNLNTQWPQGPFKIFEGYVTGSGFRRNMHGADLVLSLTHWLTDLNFSSSWSKQTHPLNAAEFWVPAQFVFSQAMQGGANAPVGPFLVMAQIASTSFSPTIITTDFWGGTSSINNTGLKQWLLTVTRTPRINFAEITSQIPIGSDIATFQPALNWEACRALQRFEPNAILPDSVESGYVLGVALALSSIPTLDGRTALAIAEDIGRGTLNLHSNSTFWDKLAGEIHADYMLSVVPLVDKALVVPFVPGLSSCDANTLVHRTLFSSDYESIELQSLLIRPLRAVGLIIGREFQSGGGTIPNQPAQYTGFGGWFDKMTAGTNNIAYKEGLILFKQGPAWLTNLNLGYLNTQGSTGLAAGLSTITAVTGGIAASGLTPRQVFQAARPIWNAMAQTWYIHEVLKNRQGVISTPVRFDIAPGSSIKLEVAEDKYVKDIVNNSDGTEDVPPCKCIAFDYYWCAVLRVSTLIDCQNMRANTTFHVAHVRNQEENGDTGTSTGKHPVWQKYSWAGCVMVQDNAFAPLVTKVQNF